MKIVLCANTSWYIYNYRRNLISAIQQHGHVVYVIAPSDRHSVKLRALGVECFHFRLHQTSKRPYREWLSLIDLFFLLKKIAPDMILTFTVKCNLYMGFINKFFRFSHVANISGLGEVFDKKTLLTSLIVTLYNFVLKDAQKIFFQNQEDLQTFTHQNILPAHLCERIPGSGVDLERFRPASSYTFSEEGKRIFLMFGRILSQKRYDLFLEAAKSIVAKNNGHSVFWVLGIPDESRKDSKSLFQQIQKYHAEKIITYFPPTDNVIPIIQQADVVVLPSEYNEGVPRSLLEAMACGKPIITTNWKGCRDTVDEGINGYLIEKGDLESLKAAICFFTRLDRDKLHKMGDASRKKATQEFNVEDIVSKYLQEFHVNMK